MHVTHLLLRHFEIEPQRGASTTISKDQRMKETTWIGAVFPGHGLAWPLSIDVLVLVFFSFISSDVYMADCMCHRTTKTTATNNNSEES